MTTMKDLIEEYNSLAAPRGLKAVKRFATTKDGLRRIAALAADKTRARAEAQPLKFVDQYSVLKTAAAKPTAAKSVAKPAKPAAKAPVRTVGKSAGGRETMAGTIQGLIRAGKSNADIIKQLALPDEKRHYPCWYRGYLRRGGHAV